MLKQLRRQVIQDLWLIWSTNIDMQKIQQAFPATDFFLDHFAIIDLPSPQSGIPMLTDIFKTLDYTEKGQGYLPEKQNDFHWLSETQCEDLPVREVLPQIVIADFRLAEMSAEVRAIIEKYVQHSQAFDIHTFKQKIAQVRQGDALAYQDCRQTLVSYFAGRDWPLPSVREFETVQAFNELLAWVLIFGRKPNHFTLSIHLLNQYQHMADFLKQMARQTQLVINQKGGEIKGGQTTGIAQSSTMGELKTLALPDGEIAIATGFVEFVWRYPKNEKTALWGDYFTGFIPTHANRVIESLYLET